MAELSGIAEGGLRYRTVQRVLDLCLQFRGSGSGIGDNKKVGDIRGSVRTAYALHEPLDEYERLSRTCRGGYQKRTAVGLNGGALFPGQLYGLQSSPPPSICFQQSSPRRTGCTATGCLSGLQMDRKSHH